MKESSTATERVGRYQLLEPIGGGPNGTVSRAKVFGVAGFERQFAVKRFLPELTVGTIAQALSAAARSYGSLEHPRIARMSEFGVAQGQTFTAVEYVAGLDAFRLMQETKLAGIGIAAGGALALVSQAARAVGYAHGRGLSHLGLAPSNVIVTADGDVKVTDFGILAATMPPRPVEVTRLAQRIPYLAPEQLSGEATSAATDVFVLGVIAYELVTGQRAYRGETPAQIAQAIQAGPPAEPPLPRPIVRVLQRCLARSPFERFPDARALADALDAALRVAPVPGTRKDIGAQIKATLDRYASLNEGNLSGMVALNLQTAPLAHATHDQAEPIDISTQQFTRNEARTEPSPVVVGPESTLRDMAKPFSTVPGIAPPPIPVPPGVTPPPSPPMGGVGAKTMLGLPAAKKSVIPSIVLPRAKTNGPPAPPLPRQSTPPPMPVVQPPDEVIEEPSGLIEVEDILPQRSAGSDAAIYDDQATTPGMELPGEPAPPPTPPSHGEGQTFETNTGEMSPVQVEEYSRRSVQQTSEIASLSKPTAQAVDPDARAVAGELIQPLVQPEPPPIDQPTPIVRAQTAPHAPQLTVVKRPANKTAVVLVSVLAIGGLGAAGWYAYTTMNNKEPATKTAGVTPAKADAAVKVTADAATSVATADAAVPVAAADAAAKVAADAGSQVAAADAGSEKPGVKPTTASDALQISSKPAGARVFIDGADQGVTPVKLPGSADRHTMVVLQPGHELYIGEVDGHGVFDVALKPVTPSGGHAGIKVIKCKAKERYYVYVDGNPTGMTCPTERIDTVVGAHTVEIYDIVTDSRRKFDVNVKDERLSARVRIDD